MSVPKKKIAIREYQMEAAASFFHHITEGDGSQPVLALPTGTGKTVLFNYIIYKLIEMLSTARVLVVTHDATIIDQNANSMLCFWPNAPVGIYSAGLDRRDTHSQILYAGVQSIFRKPQQLGAFDFVFIDEAHMVSDKDETMYQKLINGLRERNPDLWVVGFSATPYRMGVGLITNGRLFQKLVVDMTGVEKFMFFVEQGYLCRLVTKKPKTQIDLHDVKMMGNEFEAKSLAAASDTDYLNEAVVDECIEHGSERHHWLGFATSVKHATNLVAKFKARGVSAAMVHGEMKPEQRTPVMDAFHKGTIRCVVNVGVLSTGYDFPALDLIFVVRGTQSTSLWVQMLGRGTRPFYAPGFDLSTAEGRLAAIESSPKQNTLVLDFAGNTPRLGPINDPCIPQPRKKGQAMGGEAPYKVCPSCNAYNHTRATVCKECGAEFPPPSSLEGRAGTDAVMKDVDDNPRVEEFDVFNWSLTPGITRENDRPCIKVAYNTLGKLFRKVVVLDMRIPGIVHSVSASWWRAHGGKSPCPETPEQFMSRKDELTMPNHIHVITNRPHKDIVGYFATPQTLE